MLEQKLAEANQAAQKKRLKLALIFVGAAAFVGLFLIGFIRLDLNVLGLGSGAGTEVTETVDPILPAESAGSIDPPTAPQDLQAPVQQSTIQSPAIIPPANPVDQAPAPAPTAPNTADRETFMTALATFDRDIRPLIENEGFKAWDNATSIEVMAKRDEATSAFSVGEYDKALERLKSGAEQAIQKVEAFEDAYSTAFQDADIAYQAEDVEAAQLNITEALRLKPDSVDAQKLETQINRLPKVLSLMRDAVTARVENDLQREASLLREIIDLDPTREEQKARLATVVSTIRENQFASYISKGMTGVEQRNLGQAQSNLRKAQQLFKTRDAVSLLASQVETLRLEIEAEALVKKGIQSSSADEWEQARAHFIAANKILPDNKESLDGFQLSSKIIDLKKKVTGHLNKPERLSNASVADSVEVLLEDVKVFEDFSPSLKARSQELSAFAIVYSTPVPVMVVSDGETQVSVRGVGQVGKTTGRTINLKPGTYSFEGKRPGYIAKLIKVEIPPGAQNISIEVICDEPI